MKVSYTLGNGIGRAALNDLGKIVEGLNRGWAQLSPEAQRRVEWAGITVDNDAATSVEVKVHKNLALAGSCEHHCKTMFVVRVLPGRISDHVATEFHKSVTDLLNKLAHIMQEEAAVIQGATS